MDASFFENRPYFSTHLQGEIGMEDSSRTRLELGCSNLNFSDLTKHSKNSDSSTGFLFPIDEVSSNLPRDNLTKTGRDNSKHS